MMMVRAARRIVLPCLPYQPQAIKADTGLWGIALIILGVCVCPTGMIYIGAFFQNNIVSAEKAKNYEKDI